MNRVFEGVMISMRNRVFLVCPDVSDDDRDRKWMGMDY